METETVTSDILKRHTATPEAESQAAPGEPGAQAGSLGPGGAERPESVSVTRIREGGGSPPLKLKLSTVLSAQVRDVISELSRRGVHVTPEELLDCHLSRLSGTYLSDELEARTPERFYIQVAMDQPKVKDKLIRQAKRALNQLSESSPVHAGPRRRRRAEQVGVQENAQGTS